MPSKKELSPEDIREIVAARGTLTAKEIQKKFGIGTTRLYRIWREAGVVPGKTSKTAETAPAIPASQQPLKPPAFFEESAARPATPSPATAEISAKPVETAGKNWQDVLLPQILAGIQDLQNNMALLMETQESHYEDVEDIGKGLQGLEAEVEETGEGILESIERNSNAVRAETDKTVGAANAAGSAALGVGQVLVYATALAALLLVLYRKMLPKVEEWKQQNAASEEWKQQNAASEEWKQRNAAIEELDKPPKQSKQPLQPVERRKKGIRSME